MTSNGYEKLIDNTAVHIKKLLLSENPMLIPREQNNHLCNICDLSCKFCESGSKKVENLYIKQPQIFLKNLNYDLNLTDNNGGIITKYHFDGDSGDPVSLLTKDILSKGIQLIRSAEQNDNKNRAVILITNGVHLNKLHEDTLNNIDFCSVSINASDRSDYHSIMQRDRFDHVLENTKKLCLFRDKYQTNQMVQFSYVLYRDEANGITNFSKIKILKFIEQCKEMKLDCLKFRFDFNETSITYQNEVMNFINSISGDYKPMSIFIQKPPNLNKYNDGFEYCFVNLLFALRGPDGKRYSGSHCFSEEISKMRSVFKIETEDGICRKSCTPFIRGINERLNKEIRVDGNFRKVIDSFVFTENIYPIVRNY